MTPPFLACCGVVVAEFEEVSEEGDCAGDFGDAFDVGDVGFGGVLRWVRLMDVDVGLWLLTQYTRNMRQETSAERTRGCVMSGEECMPVRESMLFVL